MAADAENRESSAESWNNYGNVLHVFNVKKWILMNLGPTRGTLSVKCSKNLTNQANNEFLLVSPNNERIHRTNIEARSQA